jgi:capsular polysaccharide biosynthesis protein
VELHHYFVVLRRRLVIVIIAVLAAMAAGYAFTPRASKYSASATIYVGARQFSVAPDARYAFDPTLLVERLMDTYAKMLDSESIAEDAVRSTRLPRSAADLVNHIKVTPVKNTQLLTVSVSDKVARNAKALTNATAKAFVDKVATFDANSAGGEGVFPQLPAYVFQSAKLPTKPVSTGLSRNVAAAGVVGLLLSVGIVFLLEYLDITLKNPAEAESRLQLPVLGVIPYDSVQDRVLIGGPPPAVEEPKSVPSAGVL